MARISNISERIRESIEVKQRLLKDGDLTFLLDKVIWEVSNAVRNGKKVLFCGNGGSAADAQHLAAELSGRFYLNRKSVHAEALHVNTSYITAAANDFSFDEVYSRLIEGKGIKGDILIALSTSGNSKNVVNAARKAHEMGMVTIGMTGRAGGALENACDYIIKVPSDNTPRIQEAHILLGHIICEMVEKELFGGSPRG